ncbi:MAG: glycosyltransferase [Bacteroides sp.]|nr:glycosyltransferase [Roseburia sp.]MCM1346941.1 glycosyltransferase [Bacteroides sp.]MCM1421514.1 glycosyltransferase [Bacteroides sp.]
MTVDILICTLDSRIKDVVSVIMEARENIRYIVSMQYTSPEYLKDIPKELKEREDVDIFTLEGRGLSRNRNFALSKSKADICIVSDDDARYKEEYINTVLQIYESNKDTDIALFQTISSKGIFHKKYPENRMSYAKAEQLYYYPTSVEITFRRDRILKAGISFNEHYGLGADFLVSGEESVFLKDAEDARLTVEYFPHVIAESPLDTTGEHFLTDIRVQRSKGATFCYCYGLCKAVYLCLKECAFYLFHKGANPFPLMRNMADGIIYCKNIVWRQQTAALRS